MAAKAPATTMERNIRFYRADAGLSESKEPLPFDVAPALQHIDSLEWAKGGRYSENKDGDALCCWVHPKHERRACLAMVRRSGLPQVESAGKLRPLRVPVGAGLAEQTHMVFFPNNIVGCEYNFYGPRISRFPRYLAEKAPAQYTRVRFNLLLRDDMAKRLEQLEDIRFLQLRIARPTVDLVQEINADLGTALTALANAAKAQDIEVILRAQPRTDETLTQRALSVAKRLLKKRNFREQAKRFVVRGHDSETGRVEELDLLTDALIVKRVIVRASPDARALDSESAFAEIEAAYREKKEEIAHASSVSLGED